MRTSSSQIENRQKYTTRTQFHYPYHDCKIICPRTAKKHFIQNSQVALSMNSVSHMTINVALVQQHILQLQKASKATVVLHQHDHNKLCAPFFNGSITEARTELLQICFLNIQDNVSNISYSISTTFKSQVISQFSSMTEGCLMTMGNDVFRKMRQQVTKCLHWKHARVNRYQ